MPDSSRPPAKTRLFVLLAREAHRAVILRRGPSRSVLMVAWDTAADRFEEGQWLRGRIYERRCDLTPSGEKLLYFAAKWGSPMQTYSAISRPPYFTALALWPKGDAYGGGGLFDTERSVTLNHPYMNLTLAEGHSLPPRFAVREMELRSRGGEDFPLYGARLLREGWSSIAVGEAPTSVAMSYPYAKPVVFRKPRPLASSKEQGSVQLEMRILGVHEKSGDGDWWVVEHRVIRGGERLRDDELVLDLGRAEWADWDRNGDLLFAKRGALYRLPRARGFGIEDAKLLVDLRDRTFTARPSPASARRW